MIKSLYQNSTNVMMFNSIQGQMFKITVGVGMSTISRRETPVLFNIFIEDIMPGIQDEHISKYQLVEEIYLLSDSPMI